VRLFDGAEGRLLQLVAGKWIAAAIAAAAELGVADVLAEGPRRCEDLARVLGCEEGALLRVMRVLSGEGLVEADIHGVYSLTAAGEPLREGQLRDLVRFSGKGFAWEPWSRLTEALRSKESAFELTHGEDLFTYLDGHPEESRIYHAAIDSFTRAEAHALAASFDFSEVRRVVDVGGGLGTLLAEVWAHYPHLEGVLYDRPSVIDEAEASLRARVPEASFEYVGGDFLLDTPPSADLFILKHVLHNWNDAQAKVLLQKCVAQLTPGGRVLIVEGIVLPGNLREGTRLLDLEMLVLCGQGRERTKAQFRALLRDAGLKLVTTCDLAGTTRLIIAEPR